MKSGDAGSRGSLMKHLGEQEKKVQTTTSEICEGQPVICQAAREGTWMM